MACYLESYLSHMGVRLWHLRGDDQAKSESLGAVFCVYSVQGYAGRSCIWVLMSDIQHSDVSDLAGKMVRALGLPLVEQKQDVSGEEIQQLLASSSRHLFMGQLPDMSLAGLRTYQRPSPARIWKDAGLKADAWRIMQQFRDNK